MLSLAQFAANASGTAQDSSDRIIYETDTGKLFYDSNGSTAGAIDPVRSARRRTGVNQRKFHCRLGAPRAVASTRTAYGRTSPSSSLGQHLDRERFPELAPRCPPFLGQHHGALGFRVAAAGSVCQGGRDVRGLFRFDQAREGTLGGIP